MISRVIIIGGHIQALGVARQAHRLGVEVILYLTERFSVARWSNAVDKTLYGTLESFVSDISPYRNSGTLLFPTGDDALEFLNRHRDSLSNDFILGIPSEEVVNIFADKRKTAKFASQYNIPHPECFCPESLDDIINRAASIKYPVVLKPAVMYTFHRQFGKKAFLCRDSEELLKTVKEIKDKYPINQIILQEYLSGGPQFLYSYGVFAADGIPRAWIMANRIRQNPMDFGNSTTFAVTCNIPEIEKIARQILETTNYTGLAEIEFMYNRQSQRYEILEINTRAWKWHTLSEKRGFGFFEFMLKYMNGESPAFSASNKSVAWVERLTDIVIIAKEILHKRISCQDVKSSYKMDKQFAVWSKRDPLPSVMYLLQSPILYFTRR